MTDDVWTQIRAHQDRIEELRRTDVEHSGRLQTAEQRIDTIITEIGSIGGESRQMHKETTSQLSSLNSRVGELVGTSKTLMWVVPLIVAIICAAAGVIAKMAV